MKSLERDLLHIPVTIYLILNLIDYGLSSYVVNVLDIGMYEMSVVNSDEFGDVAVKRGAVVLFLKICGVAFLLRLVLMHYHELALTPRAIDPKILQKQNPKFTYFFIPAWTLIFTQYYVTLIWNPYILLVVYLENHSIIVTPSSWVSGPIAFYLSAMVVGATLGLYWFYSFLWRFLTSDAQKQYGFLQWPYRLKLMSACIPR